MANDYSTGIVNDYVVIPKNLTQYTALRGVVDFSQIGQFDQFETGYSFLSVISMPKFITELAIQNETIKKMVDSFKHMLEYEFRGLSGLPNITSNTFTITDGSNEQQMINDVVMDTSVELTANYFERSGSLITRFIEYYLTGIKDPKSKAKTYHGLIRNNKMHPSLENEVFTFMYYVTDNTFLRLEKAYLLANVQITQAETSMYDSEKGQIQNKEIGINFRCFPITGYQVDKAAKTLLEDITGVAVDVVDNGHNIRYSNNTDGEGYTGDPDKRHKVAALDSNDYLYGIMDPTSVSSYDQTLYNALQGEAPIPDPSIRQPGSANASANEAPIPDPSTRQPGSANASANTAGI